MQTERKLIVPEGISTNISVLNPEADSMIRLIERASRDPSVNMEKMQGLYEMKKDADKERAIVEFNIAMMQCQQEMLPIGKNAYNNQTKSKYANLEAVNNQIVPIYTKHGFSISFGTVPTQKEGQLIITAKVRHVAGHSEDYQLPLDLDGAGFKGTSNKTGVQAGGSTVSYARRYLTHMIFNLTTCDDNDGQKIIQPEQGKRTITDDQIANLLSLAEEVETPIDTILRATRITNLSDMTVSQFSGVMKKLEDKQKGIGNAAKN